MNQKSDAKIRRFVDGNITLCCWRCLQCIKGDIPYWVKRLSPQGVKAYLSRDKVPSKLPCAYAQNTLRLYAKHLVPMPKIETAEFQWLTNMFVGTRSVAP